MRKILSFYLLLVIFPLPISFSPVKASGTYTWITCGMCPDSPEVNISDDTITMGVANRAEDGNQNISVHGASTLLPPADQYTITFEYQLFSWDSYHAPIANGKGYWDSFSVSVSNQPYWELYLLDPVTPTSIPGLGFIWGGNHWGDHILKQVSGTMVITAPGNPSGNNYLNVILDTKTDPYTDDLFPSWGTIRIVSVSSDQIPLSSQAADLAKQAVGAPYLWGGKGWDFLAREFVEPSQIFSGYNYWGGTHVAFGSGLDCSGLTLWSYNKSFGATKLLNNNPISYESADGQYRYNTNPIIEAELLPGDLLFFDNDNDNSMDHVAMYVGDIDGNDVVHAARPGVGIIWDRKDTLKQSSHFRGFRRVRNAQIGFSITTHSPVTLIVTDPDGHTISSDTVIETEEERLTEIPGVLYYIVNENLDTVVIAPELKNGNYIIKVIPKTGASPTDTYSLEVVGAGRFIDIATDVPISEIPPLGYLIQSTGDEVNLAPFPSIYLPLITLNGSQAINYMPKTLIPDRFSR